MMPSIAAMPNRARAGSCQDRFSKITATEQTFAAEACAESQEEHRNRSSERVRRLGALASAPGARAPSTGQPPWWPPCRSRTFHAVGQPPGWLAPREPLRVPVLLLGAGPAASGLGGGLGLRRRPAPQGVPPWRQVSADVAAIRAAISATDEAVNAERADMLAPLIHDVRARSDRAAALIAVVPDEGVRHAADNVYDSFGQWLSEEVDSLTNETAAPSVDELLASPGKLATAVRDFLIELQVREKSAVEKAG